MIKKRDLHLISHLRKDARQSLADISKKTDIPITTIYDNLKLHEQKLIKRYTALLDFKKLGFHIKANIALMVAREDKARLENYLMKHSLVNSLYRINGSFDFLAEVLFKEIKDVELFVEEIEGLFKIKEKRIFHILDDLKQEDFLSNQDHIKEVNHTTG